MLTSVALLALITPTKHPYSFNALFLEGCSCKDICVTEITGRDAGCHGIAAMQFRTGSYAGRDFSGARAAWAWDSGKWVRIYIDAPESKRAALSEFLKAMLADWGKLEGINPTTIKIVKQGKGFAATIAGNKEAAIQVSPVFGADGKTAVVHTNLTSPLHSTLMQGETSLASYLNAAHPFKLQKTNAFYHPASHMKGKI
jgi:hypothetical protein